MSRRSPTLLSRATRGWTVPIWAAALVAASALASNEAGVVEGVRPDDRPAILLDGGYLTRRIDGGWAEVRELPDGGFRLYPTDAPDGYFLRDRNGKWSIVRLLPDGGQLVTPGRKPPGY